MHGDYELLEGVVSMASTHRPLLHSMDEIDTPYFKQAVTRWFNDANRTRGMRNSRKGNCITGLHLSIIRQWIEATGRRDTSLRQLNQVSKNSRKD